MKYLRGYNESNDLTNSEFSEIKRYIKDILQELEDDGVGVEVSRDNPDIDVIICSRSAYFDINKYTDSIYSLGEYAKSVGFIKSAGWIANKSYLPISFDGIDEFLEVGNQGREYRNI